MGLVPDDDRIDEVIAEMAGPSGQDLTNSGSARRGRSDSALRADLAKQAAMEWLTDNVELVDEDGEAIDAGSEFCPQLKRTRRKSDR